MPDDSIYTIELKPGEEANSIFIQKVNYELFDFEAFSEKYDYIHSLVFEKTIIEIQQLLLDGIISCIDLVKYYIYRMHQFDNYHAMISINPNIINEAEIIDEKISSGLVGELFGTVVTLKDTIGFEALPTTAGAYVLRNSKTLRDANLVSKLKEEDALIIGKSNLAEWGNCISMPSLDGYSTLGGHTKNPYGAYEVGSSSSGSAVSVSLNLAMSSIGTEFCGSLIGPAGQNSTVSIKPSLGLISGDLMIPLSDVLDTAGPIGRTVEDVYKVFKVMVGSSNLEGSEELVKSLNMTEKLNYSSTNKVGVYHSIGEDMSQLIKDFENLGIEVVSINFDHVDWKDYDLKPIIEYGIVQNVKKYLNHPDVVCDLKNLEEIVSYNQEHNCVPYGQKVFLDALESKHDSIENHISQTKNLCSSSIDYLLDKYNLDMLLSVNMHLAALYSPAGYPALTVPAGYKDSGEPFAMTLVGPYLSDIKLLETAKLFEDTYAYRRPPGTKLFEYK